VATVRITAGTLRGRRIPVPPADVRPTSERARQAFFSIVGARIDAARFLELFAGSGIFSFEAVSRGAVSATAVERDHRRSEAIAVRAKEWSAPITAISDDVLAVLPRLEKATFDVVYADPPYDYPAYHDLLAAMNRHLSLGPEPVVAIEHRRRTDPFAGATMRLRPVRRAEYGEVWITFFGTDAGLA
jgi:16S rRNA (guanine966-N2)-methyltransferase